MKKIEMATATKINIPRMEDNSTQIVITGASDGLHQARAEVQLISDEQVCKHLQYLQELILQSWFCPLLFEINGLKFDLFVTLVHAFLTGNLQFQERLFKIAVCMCIN